MLRPRPDAERLRLPVAPGQRVRRDRHHDRDHRRVRQRHDPGRSRGLRRVHGTSGSEPEHIQRTARQRQRTLPIWSAGRARRPSTSKRLMRLRRARRSTSSRPNRTATPTSSARLRPLRRATTQTSSPRASARPRPASRRSSCRSSTRCSRSSPVTAPRCSRPRATRVQACRPATARA